MQSKWIPPETKPSALSCRMRSRFVVMKSPEESDLSDWMEKMGKKIIFTQAFREYFLGLRADNSNLSVLYTCYEVLTTPSKNIGDELIKFISQNPYMSVKDFMILLEHQILKGSEFLDLSKGRTHLFFDIGHVRLVVSLFQTGENIQVDAKPFDPSKTILIPGNKLVIA